MRYTGIIQDGKIVLDAVPLLPDGTRVVVGYEAADDTEAFTLNDISDLRRGWAEAYPGEMRDIMADRQREREEEIRMLIERDERMMRFTAEHDTAG